ncbi:MAG: M3 family metallopeptidase [Gammaproteobacteria bacterium]|nr:M3 family metallopeptidase [Gammaproteobacteria bacterium]
MSNPLLTKKELPQFNAIKPNHITPAINKLLANCQKELESLLKQRNVSWNSLMEPLSEIHEPLSKAWGIIDHLSSVMDNEKLRKAHDKCLPKISAYYTALGHNTKLYKLTQKLRDSTEYKKYDVAQKKIIDNMLRDFKLSGVTLTPKKRAEYAELQQELSLLTNKFSHNVLDATYGWHKLVTNRKELKGLPKHIIKQSKIEAQNRKMTGWILTLAQPTYIAVMTYADSRKLRKEFYYAYATRASEVGPNAGTWDNSQIMQAILEKRLKLAKLIGFDNFAELSLATKMAHNGKEVINFLNKLVKAAKPYGKKELETLQSFAPFKLEAWDLAYYSETLKQEKYAVSEQELQEYFPLDQALDGMFKLVKKLFDITIREIKTNNIWHKDVKVFEVYDKNKKLRSTLFMDLYARPGKRNGAWMNDFQSRHKHLNGTIKLPIAFIVCNFTAPTGRKPTTLLHGDVETLFHEFGHSLQHMLTNIDYEDISGINGIPWDAVELPSQFMENWCWEKQVINTISRHTKTQKKLPTKLFNRMLKAKNFQSSLQMLRQLEFSLFDFKLHMQFNPKKTDQIKNVLETIRNKVSVISTPKFNRFPNSFLHIFAGGYAAGYYSYKWAEVLSTDAFAAFEENGIFDKKTAQSFMHNFLEPGGSIDPAILFKRFRGRKPKIDALLKHNGIA